MNLFYDNLEVIGLLGVFILLVAVLVLFGTQASNMSLRMYNISRYAHMVGISVLIVYLCMGFMETQTGGGVGMAWVIDVMLVVLLIMWYVLTFRKLVFPVSFIEQQDTEDHVAPADTFMTEANPMEDSAIADTSVGYEKSVPEGVDEVNEEVPSEEEGDDSLESKVDAWLQKRSYVNPEITINQVHAELCVSASILNYYIENVKGISGGFRKWIQTLRIEEAKRLMIENPNVTLDSIAEQVGLSNGSALARAFKSLTGTTPTEWIRHYKRSHYNPKRKANNTKI